MEIWTAAVPTQVTGLATTVTMSSSPIQNTAVLDVVYLTAGATAVPSVTGTAQFANVQSGTPTCPITTTNANDQVMAYCFNVNGIPAAGAGYTLTGTGASDGIYLSGELATASVPAAGTVANPSFTTTGNTNIVGAITLNAAPIVPLAPTGLVPTVIGNELMLNANTNAAGDNVTSYNLYSGPTVSGAWTLIASENVPNFEIAQPSGTYYYRITAVNAGGEGPASAVVTVTSTGETQMERATVFQGLVFTAETSLGVLETTPKVFELPTVIAAIKPIQPNKAFRGRGQKGVIGKTRGKESTEISLSGPLGYDELVFLCQGHCAISIPATIGTSTKAKQWNTIATSTAADSPQTFTIQLGTAVGGACQISGCFIKDFSVKLNGDECTFTATLIGQIVADSIATGGITYLPAATIITTYPIQATTAGIYYGTNLASLTGLTHLVEFSFDSKDRFKPAFFRDPTKASYSGIVEGTVQMSGKLTVEEDSQAAAMLTLSRTDNPIGSQSQTYLALQSVGPIIDVGTGVAGANVVYGCTLQWPITIVKSPSRGDKDDVWTGEYDFEVANDPTIGCMTAQVTSQLLAF
jgi:hypothetical protein